MLSWAFTYIAKYNISMSSYSRFHALNNICSGMLRKNYPRYLSTEAPVILELRSTCEFFTLNFFLDICDLSSDRSRTFSDQMSTIY